MGDLPPNLIGLNFAPDAYRDAVALVTAYTHNDLDTCEALLADAGHDLACALTIIVYAAIGMLDELHGRPYGEMLESLGRTAAALAAGDEGSA